MEIVSCIRRVFGSIIAEVLTYQSERHGTLPPTQFGARLGRSTSDAVHLATKTIRDAWQRKKVVGGLFLDIKGAFLHINLNKLVHDMQMRGVPANLANWFGRLGGRRTLLTFDDFVSEPREVQTGLMQGCPSSVIGFLFYHAGLSDVPRRGNEELSVSFVDDLTYMTIADTMEEVNERLQDIMERAGGALEWSREHASTFELEKSAHMIWTKRRERQDAKWARVTRPPLRVRREHMIQEEGISLRGGRSKLMLLVLRIV